MHFNKIAILVMSMLFAKGVLSAQVWPAGLEQGITRLKDVYAPAIVPGQPHVLVHAILYPQGTTDERYLLYSPSGKSKKIMKAALLNSLFTAGSCLATLGCCFLSYKVGKWELQVMHGNLEGKPTFACLGIMLAAGALVGHFGGRVIQNYKTWSVLRRMEDQLDKNAIRVPSKVMPRLKQSMKLPGAVLYYTKILNRDYLGEASGCDCAPVYEQNNELTSHFNQLYTVANECIKRLNTVAYRCHLKNLCKSCGDETAGTENLGPWLQASFSDEKLAASMRAIARIKPCYKSDSSLHAIETYISEELYFAIPATYGLIRVPVGLKAAVIGMFRKLELDGSSFAWGQKYTPTEDVNASVKTTAELIVEFNEILSIIEIEPCSKQEASQEIRKKWRAASNRLHPDKLNYLSDVSKKMLQAYRGRHDMKADEDVIVKLNGLKDILCPIEV